MDPVTMLDASKHDTGTGQESTEGKGDNDRCDLSEDTRSFTTGGINKDFTEHPFERNIVENTDDRCDISEDTRSVMMDYMNSGVAEYSSERSTSEAVDPGAVEDDNKAEKTSTAAGTINDSEQHVSSESKDRNSDSIMSSGSAVSCGLKEGNVAGGITNGTIETHANGEDACHNLATGEVAPCEDDTTCTDAGTPHVKGIDTYSAQDGTYSEKATSNAQKPLLGNISILLSDDICLLKGVQCTEDDIIKGSTKEETSTSSEFRDGYTDNAIAGESTRGTDADGHDLAAFLCEGGCDAEMPPHVDGTCSAEDETNTAFPCDGGTDAEKMPPYVDGTCSAEDETNSISDSVCEAKKTQVSKDFWSTLEDGIIEGSTAKETSTIPDKNNDSTQYAAYEFRDGNTDNAMADESTQGADADGYELAAVSCEGGSDAEMPPHVDGTCSAEDENNSISDSFCEAKKMQVSEDFRSTLEDGIIEGSTKEDADMAADKMNGSEQYASCKLEDGNTSRAGSGREQHVSSEAKNEKCRVGAKIPFPGSSICEAKKMQLSEDFLSTSDGIVEGSTKVETGTGAGEMNGCEQYASYESEDGNTGRSGSSSEHHDVPSKAKNEICCVGAKRPFPDGSICKAEGELTFDDKFWQEYSKHREARFGRRYKRRIVWKRRKVISLTPPSSPEYSDWYSCSYV
jgi:hypothetical protein